MIAWWVFGFALQAFEYHRHPHLYFGRIWGGAQFDAGDYIRIAQQIGPGIPAGAEAYHGSDHFFLGLPSVLALVHALFGISEASAIVFVSLAASIVAGVLVGRLYGAAVAFAFGVISLDWLQASIIGASEPLFTALLLGSFACARAERWTAAALLASLATTVRPVGIFALASLAIVLARNGRSRDLAATFAIAISTGVAYLGWANRVMGDPLVNFELYGFDSSPSSWRIGFPLATLFEAIARTWQSEHLAADARAIVCVVFTLGLLAIALGRRKSKWLRAIPVEATAATLYVTYFACYAYPHLLAYWPRFVTPILPTLLYAIEDRIPTTRWLRWPCAIVAPLLAASEIVGFKTVFGFSLLRH